MTNPLHTYIDAIVPDANHRLILKDALSAYVLGEKLPHILVVQGPQGSGKGLITGTVQDALQDEFATFNYRNIRHFNSGLARLKVAVFTNWQRDLIDIKGLLVDRNITIRHRYKESESIPNRLNLIIEALPEDEFDTADRRLSIVQTAITEPEIYKTYAEWLYSTLAEDILVAMLDGRR